MAGGLTQDEIDGLKAWWAGLSAGLRQDHQKAFRVLTTGREIVDYMKPDPLPLDPWDYLPERFAKQTAAAAGITAGDLAAPSTVRSKLLAWAKGGANAGETIERVFDAAVTLIIARELQGGEPNDAETVDAMPRPVYGQTEAERLGLPDDVTMLEIEEAIRDA
jgi:hypothetical protein